MQWSFNEFVDYLRTKIHIAFIMRTGLIDFLSIDIYLLSNPWYNVASTSDTNMEVQRWKSDVSFCFIFNVRSTLSKVESKGSTTLKQSWIVFEMLMEFLGLIFLERSVYQGLFKKHKTRMNTIFFCSVFPHIPTEYRYLWVMYTTLKVPK